MAVSALSFLLNKTPDQIVNWFKAKGYTLSWDWHDTWQEAHTKAFTVAKVLRLDVLQDIRDEVQSALKNGTTFETFKKDIVNTLKKKGWYGNALIVNEQGLVEGKQIAGYRLRTIYNTNLLTSNSAGRYQSQWENRENRPYWMYVSALQPKTCDFCKSFHGKVFPADDPVWNTLYPPNHWNDECRVRSMDQSSIDRYNDLVKQKLIKGGKEIKVESSEGSIVTGKQLVSQKSGTYQTVTGYRDPVTGKTTFPGAGWNYNVGKEAFNPDLSKYDKDLLKQYDKMKDWLKDNQINDLASFMGKGSKAYVNIDGVKTEVKNGLEVNLFKGTSKIKVVKDLLDNQLYYTDYHYKTHLDETFNIKKRLNIDDPVKLAGISRKYLDEVIKNPDYVLKDTRDNAIIYGRYDKKQDKYFNYVFGIDSKKFFTVIVDDLLHQLDVVKRYEIIFRNT